MTEGEKITLMKWGNAIVKSIDLATKTAVCELILEDKDFKKTKKLNWVPHVEQCQKLELIEYDHILTMKNATDFEGDFDSIINKASKNSQEALGEPALKSVRKGDKLQLERRG